MITEKQKEILSKVKFPDEEWARDIIWLKRMDSVANKANQVKADQLFHNIINKHSLFSKKEKKFILISEKDNVWDSQRQNGK